MPISNILGIKNYSDDNTLYIPNFENRNNSYNINSIYTPRTFTDTNEYVTHLENLRKLYNSYYNYIDVSKYDEIRLHTSNILKTNAIKRILSYIAKEEG